MTKPDIDFSFIRRLEGFSSTAYVPPDKFSGVRSGITVGGGIDLGYQTYGKLKKLFLSDTLPEKLAPYLGLLGKMAIRFLKLKPLVLSPREAEQLTAAVINHHSLKFIKHFNKHSNVKFRKLMPEFQTVLVSINLQYGNLRYGCPKFWKQMTTGDYTGALSNLRNFQDSYNTRRNREADLFEIGLNKIGVK